MPLPVRSWELPVPLDPDQADQLKQLIVQALDVWRDARVPPLWTLAPAESSFNLDYLRRRRAVLLLALALPGLSQIDKTVEEHAHRAVNDVGGLATLIECFQAAHDHPCVHVPYEFRWLDWDCYRDTPGQIVVELRQLPGMVVANLSEVDAYLTDGSVIVQSHPGRGAECATSDNDFLPPLTTCWLASK